LEYISKSPHISILLNLFQEHLDHYLSFEDYQLAKINIARYQEASGYFIFNADDNLIEEKLTEFKPSSRYFPCTLKQPQTQGCWSKEDSIYFSDGITTTKVFDLDKDRFLKGEHNVRNIMAAICACKAVGIPDGIISQGISTFQGLEHRIEYVGEYNGAMFYNDSIATIPEATIEAIKTLVNVETLILGGFDRGIDYDSLLKFLVNSSVKNIVMLGAAGKRMMEGFKDLMTDNKNLILVDTFEDAVKTAKFFTLPKGICLLSPAAASYDMFENFEERGRVYKKLVRDP
jgi:UDP-N-acetylmuramoyl-L-alanine---L-glutamate ligase